MTTTRKIAARIVLRVRRPVEHQEGAETSERETQQPQQVVGKPLPDHLQPLGYRVERARQHALAPDAGRRPVDLLHPVAEQQ